MKTSSLLLILLFSVTAHAELTDMAVFCTRTPTTNCLERVVTAFQRLECSPVIDSVKCNDAATDPSIDPSYRKKLKGKDLCRVQSNCKEPNFGNFGQVSCDGPYVDLKNVDYSITLTTSSGLLQRYVTKICK